MAKKIDLEFDIEISCQNCGKNFQISTKDIGKSVTCPHCNSVTQLKDNGFTNGIQKVNKSLNELFKI